MSLLISDIQECNVDSSSKFRSADISLMVIFGLRNVEGETKMACYLGFR